MLPTRSTKTWPATHRHSYSYDTLTKKHTGSRIIVFGESSAMNFRVQRKGIPRDVCHFLIKKLFLYQITREKKNPDWAPCRSPRDRSSPQTSPPPQCRCCALTATRDRRARADTEVGARLEEATVASPAVCDSPVRRKTSPPSIAGGRPRGRAELLRLQPAGYSTNLYPSVSACSCSKY